ncbi:MAG: nucleotidyltransferase family protein [Syntrophales bacterium]|jgi:predicted nucleotidyltransferase|nr:nucleotidyltransferase family protein [Syntrophales bacterium]MDY0045046.1 nucleotidyltransferase family protein [Syntrophales bacterium]
MEKKEIIEIIKHNKKELSSRYGVKKLGLFGSYVKDRQRKRSDIDLLVTFDRDIDLFEFVDLRDYLEKRFHAKIDLVMESALKPKIGKHILAEVEYV